MREALLFRKVSNTDQFRIDYPYYGLFGSAEITPVYKDDEVLYECRLLNGSIIFLKKLCHSQKWIDTSLNIETPLSAIIGLSIDDFLKIQKGA